MKLAIFPAAGGLGGATLSHLLDTCHFDQSSLVLIARSPSKLEEYRQRGVTVRQADYDDAASLNGMFEGVDALNLISYASFEHEHRFKGVSHIFYSSLAFSNTTPPTPPSFAPHVMLAHLDTEAYLTFCAASANPDRPFAYTIIRQGLYSESFPVYTANFDLKAAAASKESEVTVRIPHDGTGPGISWAKRDELGEATAQLLSSYASDSASFPHTNKLVTLSGPKEYPLAETAEVFSRVTGKEVTIQEVSVDAYIGQRGMGYGSTDANQSAELNRLWATAFEGVKQGQAAVVTGDLGRLLGREPEGFETTLRGMMKA